MAGQLLQAACQLVETRLMHARASAGRALAIEHASCPPDSVGGNIISCGLSALSSFTCASLGSKKKQRCVMESAYVRQPASKAWYAAPISVDAGPWQMPMTPSTFRCMCSAVRAFLFAAASSYVGHAGMSAGFMGRKSLFPLSSRGTQPHRQEAEVHHPALPWQELEGTLLLLLVEGAQQLQLHLSMLGHQPRVLLQYLPWDRSHWYDSLCQCRVKSWARKFYGAGLCKHMGEMRVVTRTTWISVGLNKVTPGSINLVTSADAISRLTICNHLFHDCVSLIKCYHSDFLALLSCCAIYTSRECRQISLV